VLGYTAAAFFNSANDQGGTTKHRIDFISLGDSYSPRLAVGAVRGWSAESSRDLV
jgi:hypothetical protein